MPTRSPLLGEYTGGIYIEAKGRVLPLEELYARAIAPMEGRDIVDGKERIPTDRYQWPLALAILSSKTRRPSPSHPPPEVD